MKAKNLILNMVLLFTICAATTVSSCNKEKDITPTTHYTFRTTYVTPPVNPVDTTQNPVNPDPTRNPYAYWIYNAHNPITGCPPSENDYLVAFEGQNDSLLYEAWENPCNGFLGTDVTYTYYSYGPASQYRITNYAGLKQALHDSPRGYMVFKKVWTEEVDEENWNWGENQPPNTTVKLTLIHQPQY